MRSIVIIGIATVDALGRPVDEFPKPGGLRFFDELTLATGGCAVNCAVALARLGVKCALVTRVGKDVFGDFVIAELIRNRVNVDSVVHDSSVNTSFSFAAVRSGSMLMDSLDGPPTAELLATARAAGATTLLDTVFVESSPQSEWERRIGPALPHLDYFLPSLPEARALSGLTEPAEIARAFLSRGTRNVIIKLGAAGVYCRSTAGEEFRVAAEPVERVVDATGAGDCWSAGFLAGLAAGLAFDRAARVGNAVAACGIQAVGATNGVRPMPGLLAE
ncbi:MAG: carbohydrate kinase family protein [Planctomycetes bacterium]|nr:carbohydrate kinase family protein [Planctomycetota bacterium]